MKLFLIKRFKRKKIIYNRKENAAIMMQKRDLQVSSLIGFRCTNLTATSEGVNWKTDIYPQKEFRIKPRMNFRCIRRWVFVKDFVLVGS